MSRLLCVIICDKDTVKGELCHCVNVTESGDISAVSTFVICPSKYRIFLIYEINIACFIMGTGVHTVRIGPYMWKVVAL